MNKKEIIYLCDGLASTWMENHKSIIQNNTVLSIEFKGENTTFKTVNELSEILVKYILSDNKGTINFMIDKSNKEAFDII